MTRLTTDVGNDAVAPSMWNRASSQAAAPSETKAKRRAPAHRHADSRRVRGTGSGSVAGSAGGSVGDMPP